MAKEVKQITTNPVKTVVNKPVIDGKKSSNIPTFQTPIAKPTKKS